MEKLTKLYSEYPHPRHLDTTVLTLCCTCFIMYLAPYPSIEPSCLLVHFKVSCRHQYSTYFPQKNFSLRCYRKTQTNFLTNPIHHSGEGNGNPRQYSCLESSMDRGDWWAIVHGVPKSQTRLND